MIKSLKKYLQVITNACVKTAVLEVCFEKNSKEAVVGIFKIICTVGGHCWYIKYDFAGLCQQVFEIKIWEDILVAVCFHLISKVISKLSSPLPRCKSFM